MSTTTESNPQIFDRWGTPLTITAFCGKVTPKWSAGPLVLLRVTLHDVSGDRVRHVYTHNLKADGGWTTIDAAVDAAPEIKLAPNELKAAMLEAE